MKPYSRFIIILMAVISAQSLLIILLDIAIDPYEVFKSPTVVGLNKLKTEKDKHVRLFKALDVIHLQPKMIFLGSSRAEFGLDPSHPVLENDRPAYNLGITGSNMYEAMRYFQHALANQPDLKRVIVGIDIFMFDSMSKPTPDFKENRLEKKQISFEDRVNISWSLNALIDSVMTLRFNKAFGNETGFFQADGMRYANFYRKYIYGSLGTQKDIFREVLKNNAFLGRKARNKEYQISESLLDNLQNIVAICNEKNIEIKIFISPAHATEWESIYLTGNWPVLEQWKREVIKIAPIWDFSGYNSITTEPITTPMKNYLDNSHYLKEVGNLVIDRMFQHNEKSVPPDFGVLLTPANIESHLAKIRDDREKWAKNNPDVVQFVEDLKTR